MKFLVVKKAAAVLSIAGLCGTAAAQLNIDFSNSRGMGTGAGKVLIENIKVLTPVPNPFDPTTYTILEKGYNIIFNFDHNTLHLVPEGITQASGSGADSCASVSVQVYNAVLGANGGAIAGASVVIGSRTATTDSQGIATFTGLAQGLSAVSVYRSGYLAAAQSTALSCAANNVAVALSPEGGQTGGLTSGQFRVILTWGDQPRDLDSHMTGPSADSSRWHVYYADETSGGLCALDVDDTTSFGPETVTCPATGSTGLLRDGVYRYSVHQYAGSGTMATSGARARLEFANGTVYNYTPPVDGWGGIDDVWTVFELTVYQGAIGVAPVNTVTRAVSGYAVRAPKPGLIQYGKPEDSRLFRNRSK